MTPKQTAKLAGAISWLHTFQLVPSAIHALTERGSDAVYAEMSRRGYVWSTDLGLWRRSRKPKKIKAVTVKTGYLDHVEARLIVRSNELDYAIAEFSAAMLNAGYEVTRVSVHTSRNAGELLVYCHIHQNGHRNA